MSAQSNLATRPAQEPGSASSEAAAPLAREGGIATAFAKGPAQRACNLPALVNLVSELKYFSCNIGLSACVANALVNSDAPIPNPNALALFSPRLSPELLEAIQTFKRLDPATQTRNLDKLLRRQQATNVSSLEVANRPPTAFRIPSPQLAQLVTSWRANCRLALDALQEIETNCSKYGVRIGTSEWWAAVCGLLNEASAGSYSCVQPDGQVAVPAWAERRKAERIAVQISAVVSRPAGEVAVTVRDISTGGLALEGLGDAAIGDEISVKLETGRVLTGTIRWVRDGKVGMEFAKPI